MEVAELVRLEYFISGPGPDQPAGRPVCACGPLFYRSC